MNEGKSAWKPPGAEVEAIDEAGVEPLVGEHARELVSPRDVWVENGGLVLRTMDMAACAFGVTRRTVCEWIARGCPGKPGRYDLPDMMRWAKANVRVRTGGFEG